MGSMFRSEKVALCQLFIQPEAAYSSVSALGEYGVVQFRDLNVDVNSFLRKYVAEVRRCDEMGRRIAYIQTEVNKDGIRMPVLLAEDYPRAPHPKDVFDLENRLEQTENEMTELAQNEVKLKKNFLELTELKEVLEKSDNFFSNQDSFSMDSSKNHKSDENNGQLGFVAGVIERDRCFAFERMLWRVSHGNVFFKRADLEETLTDPVTGFPIYKSVFVAFYQGEQLRSRITKICAGFHAALYPCPSGRAEREERLKGVLTRLEDMKMVLNQTQDHRRRLLIGVAHELPRLSIMIRKVKAIYHTLNLLNTDVTQKCLIGECWIPTCDIEKVIEALQEGSAEVGSTIPAFLHMIDTREAPPTYNRTNKFTRGFQNLIDSYGMATYRECNPALYTIITFPFLFAVMFGDLGHAIILVIFGAWMCIWERKLSRQKSDNEIWNILFAGRYIILLMGIFSVYTGFIYNDIFSKSMNLFGSKWVVNYNTSTVMSNTFLQLDPAVATSETYPWGMDPIWQVADNKIIFLNTYKMKLSIIFGVLHMVFGVCMSVVNYNYFHNRISIILEFLPQVIFLVLLFGYMVFMMFYKWVVYSAKTTEQVLSPGCAPSVLIMFINMILFKSTPPPDGCEENMFSCQRTLETVFVIVAVVCIPWMLLGKPLYIQFTRKAPKKHVSKGNLNDGFETSSENVNDLETSSAKVIDLELTEKGLNVGFESSPEEITDLDIEVKIVPTKELEPQPEEEEEEEEELEPMSEIYIHQAIHTIEYVLSTISHTASYLRLWALSLAHAQLSEVLWNMVMTIGLHSSSYVGCISMFIIFAIWAALTLAILVLMEGLSAFLHTLRLHWVEFMSKFYQGLGIAYQPFSFKAIFEHEDAED